LSEHDVSVDRHEAAMARHRLDIRKHATAIESGNASESLDLRHETDAKEHGELKSQHRSMDAIHKDVMAIVTRIETLHAKHSAVKMK
jgi:hypothetical protein